MNSFLNSRLKSASPAELDAEPEERNLGNILVQSGALKPENAERIARFQKKRGLRFGEAGLQLKLLTRKDIQHALSEQFEYPYLKSSENGLGRELIAAYEPFSPQVEALRSLRARLILSKLGSHHKTLVIVGADKGDGRSYLAANLAVVFSQLGENTLLIDADLRNARQHDIFNLDNGTGLSTLLGGRSGWDAIQKVPGFASLAVMCAGPLPPNPSELLSRTRFSHLLQELADRHDVILVDTPAGMSNADAQSITAQAASARGTALLVVRKDRTRLTEAKHFVDLIKATNVDIIGSVLNQF